MKFSVQRLYRQGVRLPDEEVIRSPRIEGELRTREEREDPELATRLNRFCVNLLISQAITDRARRYLAEVAKARA